MNIPKTSISILTELMVKKGETPVFNLIHDGGGTHQNLFIWEVICDGKSATGEGKSKKDAKQEAAKNMLELIASASALLSLPATTEQLPVRTPLIEEPPVRTKSPIDAPFRNTVGELKVNR